MSTFAELSELGGTTGVSTGGVEFGTGVSAGADSAGVSLSIISIFTGELDIFFLLANVFFVARLMDQQEDYY